MDLSAFSAAAPGVPLRLLFIHHSCGGQLLADVGADSVLRGGGECIYRQHPNGGGLRSRLEQHGYEVHEASYGSQVGSKTDAFDWVPKFRDDMSKVLRVDENDVFYTDDRINRIVVFKSCYTENRFSGVGQAPGDPAGPQLTLWNYRATLTALLAEIQKYPETMFVYVTSPPIAAEPKGEALWKWAAKTLLRRPTAGDVIAEQGRIGRELNQWIMAKDGWLKDYPLKNLAVFNYYGLLTEGNVTGLSRYAGPKGDSHPISDGNSKAAAEFVPFLNRAVRRAGLVP